MGSKVFTPQQANFLNEIYTGTINTSGSFTPGSQRALRSKVNARASRIPTTFVELMQDCRLYSATQESETAGKERIMEEIGDNTIMIADFLRSWIPGHRSELFLIQFLTGTPKLRWGKREPLEKKSVLTAFTTYLSTIRFSNEDDEKNRKRIIEMLEGLKSTRIESTRKSAGNREDLLVSFSNYAKPFYQENLAYDASPSCPEILKWLGDERFSLQFEEKPIRVLDTEVTLRCKLRLPEAILCALSGNLQGWKASNEISHSSHGQSKLPNSYAMDNELLSHPSPNVVFSPGLRDVLEPLRHARLSKEKILQKIMDETKVALDKSSTQFKIKANRTLACLRDMASREASGDESEFSRCLEELIKKGLIMVTEKGDVYSLTEEGSGLVERGLSRWILLEVSYSSPK